MSAPAATFLRATARPAVLRSSQHANPSFIAGQARAAFRQRPRLGANSGNAGKGRRWQSTAGAEQQQGQSWFKRMWDSPIGLKTVHFWAPVMKWAVVLAGVSDFARPAEKLSLTQNGALTATGLIWTRWCLIIKPKNYLLAAVNFFLGIVGIIQVSRILIYNQSLKKQGVLPAAAEAVEKKADDVKEAVRSS